MRRGDDLRAADLFLSYFPRNIVIGKLLFEDFDENRKPQFAAPFLQPVFLDVATLTL